MLSLTENAGVWVIASEMLSSVFQTGVTLIVSLSKRGHPEILVRTGLFL